MNIQEAIDIAVEEDRRFSFECTISNDEIRANILNGVIDQRGCALMKDAKYSTEITVWPPSQCTVLQDQGKTEVLPTCLL